jgi:hypothetical protein
MKASTIIFIIVILFLLYLVIDYMTKSPTLTSTKNAKTQITIGSDRLGGSSHSNNLTYSLWFYISDWNYRYGETKYLMVRSNKDKDLIPAVSLDPLENNLKIIMSTYPSSDSTASRLHECVIKNIPLQKWNHLLMSLYGRSLDVYIDGKLVKTCVLPGIPKTQSNEPLYITPSGGFAGYTAKLQFSDSPTNPQEAWNIYKKGWGGGSFLGNLFNKYRIKVAFLDDNREAGSFEI